MQLAAAAGILASLAAGPVRSFGPRTRPAAGVAEPFKVGTT